MELDFERIAGGLANLWEGLRSSTWPTAFLTDALGMSAKAAANVPKWLVGYFVVYLVAAVSALTMHFFGRQKSLSRLGDKLLDLLLTILAVPGVRVIAVALDAAKTRAAAVDGSLEGVNWLGAIIAAVYIPTGVILLTLALLLIPVHTMIKYGKHYGFSGVSWMIYDVGFGLFCISAAGISMFRGDPRWYLAIPIALILNGLGQTGGAAAHSKKQGAGAGK